MPRRIAVQEGLKNMKEELESLGYEVVDMNHEGVEAVVYMADGSDISYYGQMFSMNQGMNIAGNRGTLLINGKGKSIEELDYMIRNRLYSPLFE